MSKRYVATRVLKIRGRKIGTGNLLPEDIEPARLKRLLRLGSVVEEGSPKAPAEHERVPNEVLNPGTGTAADGPESPAETSEPEQAPSEDEDADAAETDAEGEQEGDEEPEWPKHHSGPHFILSDGTQVKGKDNAIEQQELLDELEALDAEEA